MAKITEVARPEFVERAERVLDGIKDGTLLTLFQRISERLKLPRRTALKMFYTTLFSFIEPTA